MAEYQHIFLPFYVINGIDGLFAVVVTRARWFPRYWKPLALVQVGLLDVTGTIMNIISGTVTPHFYTIITFLLWLRNFPALGRGLAERA